MRRDASKESTVSCWRPPLLAVVSILLAIVASAIGYDALFRDANRTDIPNLSLALGIVAKMGVAMLIWMVASVLGVVCCLLAIWFSRFRVWGTVAAIACLIPLGVAIAHQATPSVEKLVLACRMNDVRQIDRWLDQGVDINASGSERLGFGHGKSLRSTPLTAAAEWGKQEAVRRLLERGADPNRADGMGIRPLQRAIESKHSGNVRLLLANGAQTKHPTTAQLPMSGNRWDALAWTVWCASSSSYADDYVEIAELLTASGAQVESESLLYDAMWGPPSTGLARMLAAHRAEQTAKTNGISRIPDSVEPSFIELLGALAQGRDKRAALMIRQSPMLLESRSIHPGHAPIGKQEILILAAKFGNREVVTLLLDHGLAVDQTKAMRYASERDPLHEAAAQGNAEIVRVLLKRGASVSRLNASGATALRLAAGNGHLEATQLLLDQKADPNFPAGKTQPLFDAAMGGHLEVAKVLVAYGANPNAATQHGRPIDWARKYGHRAVVSYLESITHDKP